VVVHLGVVQHRKKIAKTTHNAPTHMTMYATNGPRTSDTSAGDNTNTIPVVNNAVNGSLGAIGTIYYLQ
jgi:hypothetical protein